MEPQEHVNEARTARGEASAMRPPSSVLAPEVPERLELSLTQLTARALSLIQPGRRVLLGIAGAPGAGKSTVAAVLQRAMPGTVAVVGMDGFHLSQDELVRLGRQDRKGAPDTFDPYGYAALLRRLKDESDPYVYAPAFLRELEEPIANHLRIERATPLVITEGNYLLLEEEGWLLARQQLDEVWYLDLPDEIRRRRLVLRHQEFGKDPETARRWAAGSDQANADIVRSTQNAANLIVTLVDG